MLEESLISLAILKVNWDERGHDYVQNFIPFVAEAIRRCPQDQVSTAQVQEEIKNGFGLIVPQGAIKTMLSRAERHGYVKREHGVFVRKLDAIPTSFGTQREDVARQQRALIEKLRSFCRDKHGTEWTDAQAEDALLSHLQHACIPILAAAVDGCPVPLPQHARVPNAEYLVSAFIVETANNDPDGFGFLETVMKGHMLATALFLPDISKARQKFDDLEVLVDTQILLRALGLEGDSLKTAYVELLTLLYQMNVSLSCFDITLDELRGILEAAEHALRDPRHQHRPGLFAAYEHFVSIGARASDVELIIANLESYLRRLHVRVKSRPAQTIDLGLNERKFEQIIGAELPNQRVEAQRHDIDCLTAIHRLRRGHAFSEIERCKYVFVTTNQALARASAIFFVEEYERVMAPLCINDQTLTTLAWVKNPTYTATFSRNRLIADSYAALHVQNDLWKKYLDEVAKLRDRGDISEDDYHLLRFSMVARNALMDATLGMADACTEGTVPEILEKAKANVRLEVQSELDAEVKRRNAAESEAAAMRLQREAQVDRLTSIAQEFGRGAGWLMYALIGVVFALGFYGTLPSSFPQFPDEYRLPVRGLIVCFALFAVWSALEGGTVRAIRRKVEVFVGDALATKLVRWLLA